MGCERTLVAHVKLFMYQYPQVLLGRTALNPCIPHPLLIAGFALTKMQDLALGLVEPQEVDTGPFLELVPSFCSINYSNSQVSDETSYCSSSICTKKSQTQVFTLPVTHRDDVFWIFNEM